MLRLSRSRDNISISIPIQEWMIRASNSLLKEFKLSVANDDDNLQPENDAVHLTLLLLIDNACIMLIVRGFYLF